jgi:hypothetical protein
VTEMSLPNPLHPGLPNIPLHSHQPRPFLIIRNSDLLSLTHPASAIPDCRSITLLSHFPPDVISPTSTPIFDCVLFIPLLISTTFVIIVNHSHAILAHSLSPSFLIGSTLRLRVFMPGFTNTFLIVLLSPHSFVCHENALPITYRVVCISGRV